MNLDNQVRRIEHLIQRGSPVSLLRAERKLGRLVLPDEDSARLRSAIDEKRRAREAPAAPEPTPAPASTVQAPKEQKDFWGNPLSKVAQAANRAAAGQRSAPEPDTETQDAETSSEEAATETEGPETTDDREDEKTEPEAPKSKAAKSKKKRAAKRKS